MELNANALKEMLWLTLNELREGTIQPAQADSIATQAREILRTVKLQLQVASQSKRVIPSEVISFSERS